MTTSQSKNKRRRRSLWTAPHYLGSLQGRFVIASLLCLPLFIGASGLLLERAFKDSLIAAEQDQLQSQLYILLGATEVQEGELWLPEALPEPRYDTVDSGLYARISSPVTTAPTAVQPERWQQQWQSRSASLHPRNLTRSPRPFSTGQQQQDITADFFWLSYDLSWETEGHPPLPLRFEIYRSRDTFWQQLHSYRRQLWYGLTALACGFLLVQLLIMRWGLRPLQRLVRELKRLPLHGDHRLQGHYPQEIAPVTDSLNEVLRNEQQQRERYRNTLGDLAHSLKTPLTILRGELQQPTANRELMQEQLERMDSIVRHQLQRAVLQTDTRRHTPQLLQPVVERLCRAMSKVYRDKAIEFDLQIEPGLSYPIESQDLFELLGNLLENACKYGGDRVRIEARREPAAAGDRTSALRISIADNGPGIPSTAPQTLLQRGARADTRQPGQGIGLAVSADIVSAYNGTLEAGRSEVLGGAEFVVTLP